MTPSRNTFTRYALTAQNPVGWDGRPRTVQLGEGSPSPSRIYYFKMLNPQSWSTTCLKTAHWSSDPAAAQRAVEQLYAGYSAAAIGASEYYAAGCS